MSSRYATYSIPLVVAVYVIFASQSRDKASRATDLMRATLGLAMLSVGICFVRAWIGREMRQEREYQRFVVRRSIRSPTRRSVSPGESTFREYVKTIKRLKCSVFADAECRRFNCRTLVARD